MRTIAILALSLLPLAAFAQQQQSDAPPPNDPGASTPAPVPSVPPASAQTPGVAAPPERIAPTDRAGTRTDAGPANATPYSGAPVPEEGRATPGVGK